MNHSAVSKAAAGAVRAQDLRCPAGRLPLQDEQKRQVVGALNVGDGLGWRGARERRLDGTSQNASPLKPVE
jgi:hypothetical protein